MSTIDPYQSPTEDLLNDDAVEVGSIEYFSPASRIGRLRFFAHMVLLTVALFLAIIFFAIVASSALRGSFDGIGGAVFMVLMAAVYIPYFVMSWVILIQRLHDLNQSGWLSLLTLVPLVNIPVWIYITCWPGTQGGNRFGKRPPPNQLWHWLVGLLLPVVLVGLLAAVALPAYQEYTARLQENYEQPNE